MYTNTQREKGLVKYTTTPSGLSLTVDGEVHIRHALIDDLWIGVQPRIALWGAARLAHKRLQQVHPYQNTTVTVLTESE